jgi:hypothetical protein
MKHLNFVLFFIIVITGFSSKTEAVSASTYPSAVAWNNFLYGLSAEEVEIKDIGDEIGMIQSQRAPMPKKNGESNEKPAGSLLFEINRVDTEDAIAVKVNDKYFKATKLGPIPAAANVTAQSKELTWIVILSVICFLVLLTLIIVWRRRQIGSIH